MDISKSLIENPYSTILSWAEGILPSTGKKAFSVLSLQPISLIIPPFYYKDIIVRSNIHTLILSPSGAGKSTLADLYEQITYNPFRLKSITQAGMEEELEAKDNVSLINDEMAGIVGDKDLFKLIEGILEEKKVSRFTARDTHSYSINLVGTFMGVPGDLHSSLGTGFLRRIVPILVFHNLDEQLNVGNYISKSIGKIEIKKGITIADIKGYYQLLKGIQNSKKKVIGYNFLDSHRESIIHDWKIYSNKMYSGDTVWYTELYNAYRYLISLAFLNYFKRKKIKKENGVIIEPNDFDLEITRELMYNEMSLKYSLYQIHSVQKKLMQTGKLEKNVITQRKFIEEQLKEV